MTIESLVYALSFVSNWHWTYGYSIMKEFTKSINSCVCLFFATREQRVDLIFCTLVDGGPESGHKLP